MIFLISFLHFVIYIFKILVSNTDFFFSCVDVLCICHYDMLFNVIIHMSLTYLSFLSAEFLFYAELFCINSCLFQWVFLLNHFSHLAQFVSVNLWIILMHSVTMFESDFSLTFLIFDAFLKLSSMQVIMLLISDYKWFFFSSK